MIQLQPLIPIWAVVLIFAPLLVLSVVLLIRRPRQRIDWLRRALLVALLVVVAIRPITPIEAEQTERMDANVFFVVDRTGSMNAEDYDGEQPRLDGVKEDMREVMSMTEGARYSIIGFDSTATSQLPLTTDAGAAEAWIDTLDTETTDYSRGSNVDRPLTTLAQSVSDAREDDPGSSVLVYFLSDGENTDEEESESFSPLSSQVDGGGVLGYGTDEGAPMKASGSDEYITDSSGAEGISTIDQEQLETIAGDMGVPYLHRTAPDEPIEGTMDGVTLSPVPTESSARVPSFDDWYWIAAIPLAALMIWELGAMTFHLPRERSRAYSRPRQGGQEP